MLYKKKRCQSSVRTHFSRKCTGRSSRSTGKYASAICSLQNERWLNRDARRTCTSYVCMRAPICVRYTCARARVRAGTDRKHRSQRMTYGCIRHARRRGRKRRERERERESGGGRGGGYPPRDGNVRMKDRV